MLWVSDPPEKITQLEATELEVGSSSTLKCFSDAQPAPTYHWDYYKTGNVQVMDVPGGSHLHINKTTDVNIGNYTCIVANDLKNISKMARVTVKGKPKIITSRQNIFELHIALKFLA